MFESAELGHKIDRDTYDAEVPKLREDLLNAQFDLARKAKFPVIIIVGGLDGAGRGETVNLLNEWMDSRFIQTHGMGDPSDEELERPMMWRFWQALPPKGKIGVFLGSWYTWPILQHVHGHTENADLEQSLERARRLEKMLTDEGALIIKFWLHLSKEKQKARLKILEDDPKTRWRVTDRDWERYKMYNKLRVINETVIRHTSTAEAPWLILEGYDARYRNLTVGTMVLEAIRKRLKDSDIKPQEVHAPPLLPSIDNLHILKSLDLSQKIEPKKFAVEREKFQAKLALLTRDPRFSKLTVIAVFEGNDAAGKGGAIRRVTGALDARDYETIPIAVPTDEERAQPYLWRFWRHIPRRGRFAIFDRSWYGRVLVERVEKFCSEGDWMRAYSEINDFEEEIDEAGGIIVKFWLTITPEEQLARFRARETSPFKSFKITPEDWRNREKAPAYDRAVCDMIERTNNDFAPWVVVPANDKLQARITVLRTLCERIEAAL